ncbi:hypothetical protein AN913_20070 [Mycobacteroides immunogenum]|nr:hypothetical protein AN913_20070 [Mycobacteroides immunogenum]KPG60984.1 hypothetical protein AN918_09265 [Mycobacteroides immunogenum]
MIDVLVSITFLRAPVPLEERLQTGCCIIVRLPRPPIKSFGSLITLVRPGVKEICVAVRGNGHGDVYSERQRRQARVRHRCEQ